MEVMEEEEMVDGIEASIDQVPKISRRGRSVVFGGI
jgi:hypothetical protein